MSLNDIFYREAKKTADELRDISVDLVGGSVVIDSYEDIMSLIRIRQEGGLMVMEDACRDHFGKNDPRNILISLITDGYDNKDKILEIGMYLYDSRDNAENRLAYLIFLKGLVEYTGENSCIHPLSIILQAMMPYNMRKSLPEYERFKREIENIKEKKRETEKNPAEVHTMPPEIEDFLSRM